MAAMNQAKLRSPLVAVAAPALFVIFGLFIPFVRLLDLALAARIAIPLLVAAVAGVTALVDRRLAGLHIGGAAAASREFVVLLLGCALIMWGVLRAPLVKLVTRPELWIALAAATAVWLLSGVFRRSLAQREFFLASVLRAVESGSRDPSRSEALRAATRDFAIEAGEAQEALSKARRWLVFFLVWYVGMLTLLAWILGSAAEGEQIGICVSAVVALAALAVLARMGEDQHLIMEGVLPSHEGSLLSSTVSVSLFLLCGLLALLLALLPAGIPQSTVAAIVAWLLALLARIPSPEVHGGAPPPARPFPSPRPEFLGHLRSLPPAHGWELVGKILTYLGWSLLALVAAGIIWVLISPLFRLKGHRLDMPTLIRATWRRTLNSLTAASGRMIDALSILLGLRVHAGRGSFEEPAQSSERRPRNAVGRRGARMIDVLFGSSDRRFVRAFFKLVRWGEGHGVSFTRSVGPVEFAERLATRVPEASGKLSEIALLYEEHLFSAQPLSGARLATYFHRIEEVVRHERF